MRMGSRVALGPRCTVLYGARWAMARQPGPADAGDEGEQIPAGTLWHGLPAAPWR